MRLTVPVLILSAVAACSPPVPDSGAPAGVGFNDYDTYRSTRAADPAGVTSGGSGSALGLDPVATTSLDTGPATSSTTTGDPLSALAASGTPAATAATTGVTATSATSTRTGGISDEQDFSAVAERETIQSDAERLRAQREAYEVVQPTAVPARSGEQGPNIVAFALSTTNAVGQKAYGRSVFTSEGRSQRACAGYATADLAQEAFLAAGGPQKDRLNLDPDGDGFACGWNPQPYRRAAAVARG